MEIANKDIVAGRTYWVVDCSSNEPVFEYEFYKDELLEKWDWVAFDSLEDAQIAHKNL